LAPELVARIATLQQQSVKMAEERTQPLAAQMENQTNAIAA
jgi:hypothetical protein